MILETYVAQRPSRRGRLMAAILLALLVVAGVMWVVSGGARQRTMRAVRAFVDPGIDVTRSLGAVFTEHPRLADPRWTAGWSDDDNLVAVDLRVARYADLLKDHPKLVTTLAQQIAMNPSWAGIEGDQPVTVQIIFQARIDAEGTLSVQVASVRMTEVWVLFKPAAVEAFERSIETAIANADDRGRARQYRLRHEGDKALFNAGLDGPMLAGPGQANEARAACIALANWR